MKPCPTTEIVPLPPQTSEAVSIESKMESCPTTDNDQTSEAGSIESKMEPCPTTVNIQLPAQTPEAEAVSQPCDVELSDYQKYMENKRLCKQDGFEPPIYYKKFSKLLFNYVRTFKSNDLVDGYEFRTLEELSLIPRKYDKPFCRPGPLRKEELFDWYLVDSIVQEVYCKSSPFPFFVVRWVGYEDEYNTVEPLANVKHTAVYKLFSSPKLYTACRLNGCILRKGEINVLEKVVPQSTARKRNLRTVPLQLMDVEPSMYERTMNKLIFELRIEEEAGRYSPDIGFCSKQGVGLALLAQHRFLIDNFRVMINQLESRLYLDEHYIGPIFGNVGKAPEFKHAQRVGQMKIVDKSNSLNSYIGSGFSQRSKTDSPHYVSFFAQRKFDTTERHDKIQLNFHMCVFTVRSDEQTKDAIYYDPSPKYFAHQLPPVLDTLTKPVLESFTYKYGDASEKDDCTFQCMRHIVGLATGEVSFHPELSEPCRKIDRFMMARKRMKFQ